MHSHSQELQQGSNFKTHANKSLIYRKSTKLFEVITWYSAYYMPKQNTLQSFPSTKLDRLSLDHVFNDLDLQMVYDYDRS